MGDTSSTGVTPGTEGAAGVTPAASSGQQAPKNGEGVTPPTFDAWLSSQDETTQGLIDGHFGRLKDSIQAERDRAKKLERDLKTATKGLDEANPLKAQLEKAMSELAEVRAEAEFKEAAHSKGISNLRLAYITAKAEDLVDERGRVDFDELKKRFPELYPQQRAVVPSANPGAGTGNGPPKNGAGGMNAFIRTSAGK